MSLKEKLIKNSTISHTSTLTDSKIYTKKDMIQTPIPMINVALSGTVDGGITPGITMCAGPSKHFKTGFSLLLASSFLRKYKDGMILFYDSEFGTPQSYFKSFNIPFDSVIHTPITDVEELKVDIMNQIKELSREDHVMIIIDSIGNLASKKEVEDALAEKSVADMSRAKQVKSLFRMVTPHLTMKDIPMIVVNHTYKEIGMFPKDIVGGGTGSYYSADNIFIIGRQQEKDGTEVTGYNFIINVEKSRYVKEKSKIPVSVSFDGGISTWSGLLELALESKHVIKPKNGWYQRVDSDGVVEEKNYREKDTDSKEFWMPILKQKSFRDFVENKYRVAAGEIMSSNIDETFDVETMNGTEV